MLYNRKKILLVIPNLKGGGAERLLVSFLNHVDAKKYEFWLCLFENKIDYEFNLPSYINLVNLNKRSKLDFFILIFKMLKLIKKERFSCVHAWLYYSILICIFVKLLLRIFGKYNFILIASTHNDYVMKFKAMKIKGHIQKIISRLLFNIADIITCVSKASAKGLIDECHINPEKVRVIYNGINVGEVINKSAEHVFEIRCLINENNFIIIYVGALDNRQKDLITLIKAFSIVHRNIKNTHLVILGKGKDQHSIEKIIKNLKISNVVNLLGFDKNPYKYMKYATVFVLSSIYEGFPMVLLEAMALKIPIVMTNISIANELFVNGEDAFIVPARCPKEMALAIQKLLKDKSLRYNFAQKSFEKVNCLFNIKNMIENYSRLYS